MHPTSKFNEQGGVLLLNGEEKIEQIQEWNKQFKCEKKHKASLLCRALHGLHRWLAHWQ